MPRDSARPRRVGDQIRRDLSEIIAREVSDPRVHDVTLGDVEVSSDLGYAKVFVTCSAGSDDADVMAGLEAATPYLRRLLAPRLNLRAMPRLKFIQDTTLDHADHIGALLAAATARHRGEE
jgi:ribosome-binding factor A